MKLKYIIPALFTLLLIVTSCDKDFVEINTNPVSATSLDPMYLFSYSQLNSAVSDYHYPGAIVQNIITPYGGVLEGGNRNTVIDANANTTFNTMFTSPIKNLLDVTSKLKDNPAKTNLYNMARIWKAYCFQMLVDTYGDVPYSEAGKAFQSSTFLPKYDDQKVIYTDIMKEYKEATDALDATKDAVTGDIFFSGDIAKWKRLGNSLLLRAGMRYTKYDEATAKEIALIAVDPARGGVMTSNADNVGIQYNSVYTNGTGNMLNGGERHNYYLGKPFVDFLRDNNDPRILYTAVKYDNPVNPLATAGNPNNTPSAQMGMPYGYDETTIKSVVGFPGMIGAAFKYSQFNRATVAAVNCKQFLITYSQTSLLLAEARQRGYITTSSAQAYYEAGIRASMTQIDFGTVYTVTTAMQDAYIAQPQIAFNPDNALKQINEQYWVSSFMIWTESWSNFRRSGYPQLSPINYAGADPSVNANGAGGFIHRLPYPIREIAVNPANVDEAATRMGGNNLGVRIFWDKL